MNMLFHVVLWQWKKKWRNKYLKNKRCEYLIKGKFVLIYVPSISIAGVSTVDGDGGVGSTGFSFSLLSLEKKGRGRIYFIQRVLCKKAVSFSLKLH